MKTTANIGCSKTKAGNGQSFVKDHGITNCIIWSHVVLLIATVFSVFGIDIYCMGYIKNENEARKRMEMNCDTKGIGIFSSGLIPEEAAGKAFASNSDDFGCISMHDLTTQALYACMWHKLLTFCIYGMSHVTFNAAALLSLNGCKKQVIASIITFIGWSGAMKGTIIHVLEPVVHLLVPDISPLKGGRRKTVIKRSSALSMLCVLFLLSAVLGGKLFFEDDLRCVG
jgi:hypothetical protein